MVRFDRLTLIEAISDANAMNQPTDSIESSKNPALIRPMIHKKIWTEHIPKERRIATVNFLVMVPGRKDMDRLHVVYVASIHKYTTCN